MNTEAEFQLLALRLRHPHSGCPGGCCSSVTGQGRLSYTVPNLVHRCDEVLSIISPLATAIPPELPIKYALSDCKEAIK